MTMSMDMLMRELAGEAHQTPPQTKNYKQLMTRLQERERESHSGTAPRLVTQLHLSAALFSSSEKQYLRFELD